MVPVYGEENLVIRDAKWSNRTGGGNVTNLTAKAVFEVPEGHGGNRWVLEAERVGANLAVIVNGKKLGECQGPIFQFPLGRLNAGTNTVELYMSRGYEGLTQVSPKTNPYLEKRFSSSKWYHLGLLGGERFVELASPSDIRQAYMETSVREKELTLKAKVDSERDVKGLLVCEIREWKKKPEDQAKEKVVQRFQKEFVFKAGEHKVEHTHPWKDPKLWDVGEPNLYWATVKLMADGKVVDETSFRFGFREVWAEGKNVMLNGHPYHMRTEMHWMPLNKKTIGFYKYMGFNSYYLQPHGNLWGGVWGPIPAGYKDELDLCDEHGLVVACPAPPALIGKEHYSDKATMDSYRKTVETYIDLHRNRPCIFAWGISMNAYNPRFSIAPTQFGQRETPLSEHHEWEYKQYSLTKAHEIMQEIDPTHLSYGHGDGNLGGFGTANCYMNNTPIQEIMEYPHYWAEHGDMPWSAVESGIFDGSLAKDNVLLLTEYASAYMGDRAYDRETEFQLSKTIDIGFRTGYYGWNLVHEMPPTGPLYYDFTRMVVTAQDRYWRSYGIFGWQHFFYANYGQEKLNGGWRWIDTTEEDEAPEWASGMVEIHRENKQELLAYIAGRETFADRTHSFFEGEMVLKDAIVVWDGAKETSASVKLTITDAETGELIHGQGPGGIRVYPGQVSKLPFGFRAPETGKRRRYKIRLLAQCGRHTMRDTVYVEVFPKARDIIKTPRKVYLYDPKGKSQWVKSLVENVLDYEEGQELKWNDALIVGREALDANKPLPFSMEMIEGNNLRVLVLEQQPTVFEAFGFKMCDMVPRHVFPGGNGMNQLMNKLQTEDLSLWHGSPTLLPEYRFARQVTQPIKGVNRHGVASTVFQIPDIPGMEAHFQCEFNQQYTPLMRVRSRNGQGQLMLSSFDFTDRVGVDPAATQLAENILRNILTQGWGGAGRKVVTRVEGSNELWKAQILLNDGKCDPRTEEFVKAGGVALNVNLADAELTKRGIQFEKRKLYRAKLEGWLAMNGITRNLMRWRDVIEVNAIVEPKGQCDGIFLERRIDAGREYFLQVSSKQLDDVHQPSDKYWYANLSNTYSMMTLDLLKARILTALGAELPAGVAERLSTIAVNEPYQTLKTWYTYGPFVYTNAAHVAKFTDVLPGEDQAIRGDINPNFTYRADAQWNQAETKFMTEETRTKEYDFRTMVESDDDGALALDRVFKAANGKPAYGFLLHTWEEEADGETIFNISVPTKAKIYANGQLVFDASTLFYGEKPMTIPRNAFAVRVPVRKGTNSLMVKLVTLPKEWEREAQRVCITRSEHDTSHAVENNDLFKKVNFYNSKGTLKNVYLYRFW